MDTTKIDSSHVVKLDGKNYQQWKLQITLVLKAADVWGVTDGTVPCPTDPTQVAAWTKLDIKAQALMVPSLNERQTSHIYGLATAHDIWTKLTQINSDSSQHNKQHTLSRFFNYQVAPGTSILDAYADIESIARSLLDIRIPMSSAAVVTKIVSALPDATYGAFKKAWDSVPDAHQTMDRLLARLRKEELETKEFSETETMNQVTAVSSKHKGFQKQEANGQRKSLEKGKRKGKCNNCGIPGHWARECRKPKQDNNEGNQHQTRGNQRDSRSKFTKRNDDKDSVNDCNAFMVRSTHLETASCTWFSDSGASKHFTGRKDWLVNYEEYEHPLPVSLTNNKNVDALGEGTVQMEALINNQWTECTINNVVYIPGCVNLFSEEIMDQKGFTIVRKGNRTIYYKDGKPGPEAEWSNGGYVTLFRPRREFMNFANTTSPKVWHERLAHINMGYIQDFIKTGAVTGITLGDCRSNMTCDSCHLGKETRQPFPIVKSTRNSLPGEVIHADLSGKMPTPSLGSASFFLLMKDDASGFRHVRFLKNKSEAAGQIRYFLKFIKNQTRTNVKVLKTDCGTEFVCEELTSFLREEGIIHDTTIPYCPETNGKIEREMRTIKDTARAMLKASSSPDFLWAEAVNTSVYIHNRLVNKQTPHMTTWEQVFKRKPEPHPNIRVQSFCPDPKGKEEGMGPEIQDLHTSWIRPTWKEVSTIRPNYTFYHC